MMIGTVFAIETFLGLDWGVFLSLVMFAVFMGLILTGYNVAFSFASVSVAFAFIGDLTDAFRVESLSTLSNQWFSAVSDTTLLAVPLFVLMGAILERSGLAERLLNAIGLLMGPLRGGVAAAVVIVGTLLAAATGVVAATVIVMGLLSLPAMVRLGYDHKLATGAITASGTLAQLLPPSIVLILLAQQLGVGILGLFAGALLPGILLSGMYVLYVLGAAYLKPQLAPAMPAEERQLDGNPSLAIKAVLALILAMMVFIVLILRGASPDTTNALSFALIGAGAAKTELQERARELELTNVSFHPPVSHENLPEMLSTADICIIAQRQSEMLSSFLAAKTFEYLASGSPIVASTTGDTASVLETANMPVVPPEDSQALAEEIAKLANDPERRAMLGRCGVAAAAAYDWKGLGDRYYRLAQDLADSSPRADSSTRAASSTRAT